MPNPALPRVVRGRGARATVAVLLAVAAAACASGGAGGGAAMTEVEWRSLALPRPSPLPGAVRLAFSGIELTTAPGWALDASVPLTLGLSELVVAGLLRRRDVQFVERRRFAEAVAAERDGRVRPPGAPSPGVSPGAELTASATWAALLPGQSSIEVRLLSTETGIVLGAERVLVRNETDPVGVARTVVGAILAALDDLGRRPAWRDPIPNASPREYAASGVPSTAVETFMRGLAAEEAWRWDPARAAYQDASRSVGFFEAGVALARTARLRAGGTLGAS